MVDGKASEPVWFQLRYNCRSDQYPTAQHWPRECERKMDVTTWFVPPSVLDDPRKTTRHKGIAKSLLVISLVTSLMLFSFLFVRGNLPPAEYVLFAAGICTPILGALLIRATGDITLGLVATNIGGILIVAVWAFFAGGITSVVLPAFLANIALLSTFGNAAILLVMGATLMAVLVFLYLATSMDWLPPSLIPAAATPELMLTTFCNAAILLVMGATLMAALVFLYLATSMGWLPPSLIPAAATPELMLT